MNDKVLIKDLRLRGIIGVNDWERKEIQDILINVEIDCDISQAAKEDDLALSVNYRSVAKKIIAHVENGKPFTVERLAEEIATICLGEDRAEAVMVRVEKPGAVRFADSVGVEIQRKKA